jgi:hypothetical protein
MGIEDLSGVGTPDQAKRITDEDSTFCILYGVVESDDLRRESDGTGTVDDRDVISSATSGVLRASHHRTPASAHRLEGGLPVVDRPVWTISNTVDAVTRRVHGRLPSASYPSSR